MRLAPYFAFSGVEVSNPNKIIEYVRNEGDNRVRMFTACQCHFIPGLCVLELDGTENTFVSTPDDPKFTVGSQPMALTFTAQEVDDGADMVVMSQWEEPDNRAWVWVLREDGRMSFRASEDGIATTVSAVSDNAIPRRTNITFEVRFEPDDGAGGWRVTFRARRLESIAWDNLGPSITGSPNMTVFNSTAPIRIGVAG